MDKKLDTKDWETTCLNFLKSSSESWKKAVEIAEDSIQKLQCATLPFMAQIIELVNETNCTNNPALLEACSKILTCISQHCPVDDIVINLIDLGFDGYNLQRFKIILDCFLILLRRNSRKGEIFLMWCLSHIKGFMKLQFSDDTCNCLNEYFKVWQLFITRLIDIYPPSNVSERNCLSNATLDTLGCKLLSYKNAIITVQIFLTLIPDPLTCFETYNERINSGDISKQLMRSYATLFHIILHDSSIEYPMVYNSTYIYLNMLPHICYFLNKRSPEMTEKGFQLIQIITPNFDHCLTLTEVIPDVYNALKQLNFLMVYNEDKDLRIRALHCFECIINCYDVKAQYYIFLYLRSSITHSGTLSFIISKIKSLFEIARKIDSDPNLEYFRGKRFLDIVTSYCFLNKGPDSYVVDHADQILSSINLFWYLLVLAERGELNITSFIPVLRSQYLEPLQDMVLKAQDGYKKDLELLKSGEFEEATENVQVVANNAPLPKATAESQKAAILNHRNAVELIQVNLNRIFNLLDG